MRWRLLLLAVCLPACSTLYHDPTILGRTLADLPPAEIPARAPEPLPVSLDEVAASYQSALEVVTDDSLRQSIRIRLADLEMAKSEDRQYAEAEQQTHFEDAINLYLQLLDRPQTQQDPATEERLLYLLAKAYALDGRVEESDRVLARLAGGYPASRFAAEVHFRRAERAFSDGRYAPAESLYQQVLDQGEQTPYYLNALYMQGWSRFKDSRFREGVQSFTGVLDRLLPEGADVEDLPEAQQNMAQDTLRVLGITFSYLDGAESITELYAELGERHYQPLLYRQLGNFYLEREFYRDAANTFAQYSEVNPQSHLGPQFAVQRIEVLRQGGMAQMMLPAKEEFVRNYGVNSEFWQQQSPEQRERLVVPTLATYLDELSSFYHSQAQTLLAQQKAFEAGRGPRPAEPAGPYFETAAEYYQQHIDTFPDSPRLAEVTFLKAEAHYQAGALQPAVDAYEQVAYQLRDPERGAEAGYAAVLALQELIDQAAGEQQELWKARHVLSARNFAEQYPGDERAPTVLARAAQDLFENDDREQAMALAERLIAWQPQADVNIQRTAWLIMAHSRFDLGEYETAEQAYRQVLSRLGAQSPERPAMVERIAASMYRHAELLAQDQQLEQAVQRLLAIEASAPGSDIAITAQYEAGNYLMDLQSWSRADAVFTDFQRRYPTHPLSATLPPKRVVIYQELELWDKAADELVSMARDGDETTRQTSLYLAAELYQRAGRTWDAALQYAAYVKAFPEPFDLATEARHQLVVLAAERDDNSRRDHWMRQLIESHDQAGDQATDRSRYLAAQAANEFALRAFAGFERIKLTLPINRSLKAKQSALEQTLAAYRKVLAYEVGEFSTEASFRIGEVYRQLSQDLLDSERPPGLDELTLEQYEILLEEQAFPFEERSVELLEANAQRAWSGFYDQWVKRSFQALAQLLPARYGKQEAVLEVSDGIH